MSADEKKSTDGQKAKAREDSDATESLASSETKNSFLNTSRKRRKISAEQKQDNEYSLALPAWLQRGSFPTIVKETQLFNSSRTLSTSQPGQRKLERKINSILSYNRITIS